ncbi:DUF423 domain-containing protein [Fuerstiella marisgermanici]|uniref:DUF423 domain-containing protein n=1 Tax=Fuerstiella marisgermanici TaxID=1891926 RepID=A0A1P8WIE3_9PLAN|nr:DUF423 domain-containing protein [Fuerstiella marisgermanici]APZ93831.1 hypothetical protein Fuma_03449 [Fuerstiella marisgermanici]
MTAKRCLVLAAVFGFLAVLLGAFGAHGLADSKFLTDKYHQMPPKAVAGFEVPAPYKYLQDYHTAVRYHMWHALALLGVGLLLQRGPSKLLSAAAWSFTAGILLFSGALYVLVIGGRHTAGLDWAMVAPFGGTLLLIGWATLAVALCRMPADGHLKSTV